MIWQLTVLHQSPGILPAFNAVLYKKVIFHSLFLVAPGHNKNGYLNGKGHTSKQYNSERIQKSCGLKQLKTLIQY